MGMFDDKSYKQGLDIGRRVAIGSVIASAAVLAILGMTVAMNKKPSHNNTGFNPYAKATEESTEFTEEPNGRTSDELSFWNMYDEEEEEEIVVKDEKKNSPSNNKADKIRESASVKTPEDDKSKNPSKWLNVSPEGAEPEYVAVNSAVPKNDLSPDGFSYENENKLVYSQGGRNVSHFGIDVSKYNGTISWNGVKKEGVEYALLRVGARGYSSGKVVLDENFAANLAGCKENGIDVGIYFFSQAINENEAVEEANYCVAALGGTAIRYPVIFDSEKVLNDSYRTENLSSTELTKIFKAFAQTVKAYGYTPMIAGTKEQLAKKFDLMEISDYDVWLLDTGETTTYPYRYAIRQYSDKGKIKGINGDVNCDICFIAYSEK